MSRAIFAVLALIAAAGLFYVLATTLAPDTPELPPVYEPPMVAEPVPLRDEEISGEGEDAGETPAPGEAARLDGRVVRDLDGVGVPGVAVTAWVGKFRRTVKTGSGGAFDFREVPAGSLRVRVRSGHLVDPPPRVERLEPGVSATIEIRLQTGAAAVGNVVDRTTGAALEGARVSVAGSTEKTVVTGPGGDYRLEGLAAGLVSISAEAEDYPLSRLGVRVAEDETEVRQDFSLVRGATVSGVVTDSAGQPLSGAQVETGYSSGRKARCGEDGRFTLRGLSVDRAVSLLASAEGFVSGRSENLSLKSGEAFAGVTIALSRGGAVVGQVLLPDGKPAVGATVRLVPMERGTGVVRLPTATTGSDGQFSLDSITPGSHRATATLKGTLGGSAEVPGVTEDGVVGGILIQLGAADGISGLVTDQQGKPVAGVMVSARPTEAIPGGRYVSARSGDDGAFTLDGLVPGRYRVSVRSARGGPESVFVEVPSGTTDVRLVMPTPGELSGRVLRPDGAPVTSATIRLRPVGTGGGTVFNRLGDPEGRFHLPGLTPGDYLLSASAGDGSTSAEIPVAVNSGAGVTGIILTLEPPGRVTGRVFSETGEPVAGAQIHASAEDGDGAAVNLGRGSDRSGADGSYELKGLKPGSWRIQASLDGLVALANGVVVTSGGTALADLRFLPTGGLLVTVRDEEGQPVVGASVHVRLAGGIFVPVRPAAISESLPPPERADALRESRLRAGRTNEDGVCRRDGIPEGEVTVTVTARGYGMIQQNHVVSARGTRSIEIVLPVADAASGGKEQVR